MKLYLSILILCTTAMMFAQEAYIPLNKSFLQKIETELLKEHNHEIHTAIKPYNHFEVGDIMDSIQVSMRFKKEINKKFSRWFFNAVFNDNFLEYKDKNNKYSIVLNPLMDIRLGSSSDLDGLPYVNTRGLQLMGHIGEKLTYYTDLYENQARFPKYVNDFIKENQVVPGQGYPKDFDSQLSDETALDFAFTNGNISYQANEYFNIQLGTGKNFIGDGHRSMLLSDNAFNYPYLKIKTSFWKLNYVNLFTMMRDIKGTTYGNSKFDRKYLASHYLSMNITKKFNVGLFEAVVYQDSTGTLDPGFFNPLILYRPIEFAVGSQNGNVLMGLTMSYKIKQKMLLYGQFMFDEFKFDEILKRSGWWANKYAFQLGFKSYDSFIPGLKLQTEINYARPFTYTHETTGRNYGHYKQPLAHPLGANFVESVNKIAYQKNRWFGELELMYAVQGRDSLNNNVGEDVFLSYNTRDSDYDNKTLQGIKSATLLVDLKLGYTINPKTNLRAELGMTYRKFNPEIETENLQKNNTTYIYLGISTVLNNKYYDF